MNLDSVGLIVINKQIGEIGTNGTRECVSAAVALARVASALLVRKWV